MDRFQPNPRIARIRTVGVLVLQRTLALPCPREVGPIVHLSQQVGLFGALLTVAHTRASLTP